MDKNIDFAFEGFRIIRHRPILILYWGVVSLILSAAVQWTMVTMFAPIMDQMMAGVAAGQTATTPAETMKQLSLFAKLLPFYGLLIIGSFIYYAVMNCAIFRAVMGSKKSAMGFLRLGADELRQVAVMIIFMLVLVLMYIAFIFAVVVVSFIGGVAAGMAGNAASAIIAVLIGVLLIAVVCAFVWFSVRMSLYTVHTFATGRIDLFGSWKLTKGRFWILFAGYLVMAVMCLLVMALFWAIFAGVSAVIGMNGVDLFSKMLGIGPKPSYAALYSNPLMIGYTLSSAFFLTPLVIALTAGAPASAYQALSGRSTRLTAENVF